MDTFQRNLPDTGLMDYKARFYSPYLNRFIQPDTLVPGPANPQSWNRYSYVGNSPINFSDPTGHMRIQDGDQRDRYSQSVASKYVPKPKPPKNNYNGNNVQKERIIRVGEFEILPNFSIPFESYSEAAEQGYDGHSWGGSLDGPLNIPVGGINVQYVSVQAAYGVSIFNDFAIGYRPAILNAVTPNTQSVYIGYTTEYNNVPRVDGTANLTLTRIMIRNEEKFTSISYNVYLNNHWAGVSLPPTSAGPGTMANIAVPNNFSISNGMQMEITAHNGCYGACYTIVNPVLLLGRSEIYVSP